MVLAACDSGSETETRAGQVYEPVVRWFAERATGDPDPLPVFVEAKGAGTVIDLEVQAAVIKETESVASVRFIDHRDEALEERDSDGFVVRDDGILIRLPPVPETGDRVTLDVDVWVDETTMGGSRFDLRSSDDGWHVVGSPIELAEVPTD